MWVNAEKKWLIDGIGESLFYFLRNGLRKGTLGKHKEIICVDRWHW